MINILNFKKNPFKIKTLWFQRLGKGLLWLLVVFLILRGVGTLFNKDSAASAQVVVSDYVAKSSYEDRVKFEASSFAEGFGFEYMTTGESEDYLNRLKAYIPAYLYEMAKSNGGVKTEALASKAYKTEWISDSQLNVYVRVKVKYSWSEKIEDQELIRTDIDDVYIKVPVAEVDGSYIVEDYPAFIPGPNKAEIKFNFYSGTPVSSEGSREIKGVLENFFKTYYSGNSGEISYYMAEGKKIGGIEGRFKLQRIDEVSSYLLDEKGNEILSLVTLKVIDTKSNMEFEQRFNVALTNSENRLYIKDFDVRIGNLNIGNGGNENE